MNKTVLLTLIVFLFAISFACAQEVDLFSLPGGEISATQNESNIKKLIDNNTGTNYEFSNLRNDIVFKAPASYALTKFAITSSSLSAEKDPKSFVFAGSHDGETWETIRDLPNYSFSARKETKTITLNLVQPYRYFRLRITAVNLADSKLGAIAEWRLYGEEKEPPHAPSDARANALGSNEVKVSWRDLADNEDNYLLYRTGNGSDFKKIAELPADANSYIDTDVYAATSYIYKVCAAKDKLKNVYFSAYSVSNSVETPAYPELTSITASGYSFTASEQRNNSPEGERVSCAFDGDVSTKYLTKSSTTWLRIDFEQAFEIKQYSVTSANDMPERDPKTWKLEASNDGANWQSLDTRTNELFDLRYQKRFFEVDNDKSYKYYRLNISKNNGDANTQLADWLLYADVQAEQGLVTPATPTDFKIESRAYHHVKLTWNDTENETAYRIERSEDGGETFDYIYEIPANNTESYPYSLKPETNYVFKLYAVNGNKLSAPATVSTLTPKKEFKDKWENYKLWILDEPATFTKVEEIGNTAFYIIDGYKKDDVNQIYYDFYAANWEYVFQCYGDELSDSRLHVLLIPTEGGGGLASIYDYRSSSSEYTNMVYIKANKDWFKNRSESGYAYDVMAHELCHIIEGVGGGYNGSMFYPVWGDSKWAEILQFDIFTALGSPRAASWHNGYMTGSGACNYPNNERVNYWYRDFFYPTYDKYGKTEVLKKFWKLQKEHYRMKNGNFQGSPENPGGRGNLGELIHFWSGACEVDVKPYAMNAFGWNEQYEMWLQKAKSDYPGITYADAPIENSAKNICQNGGSMQTNKTLTADNLARFIDNDYSTFYTVNKGSDERFTLTYTSPVWVKPESYNLIFQDSAVPQSWILSASTDGENWVELDSQDNPAFSTIQTTKNKFAGTISPKNVYKQYKFDFIFKESGSIKLVEVELFGIEHISAPNKLRAKRITDESVYVDWSCAINEVGSFELERSDDGLTFSKIADVSRYEISYTDESLTPGGYYYRVSAINKNEEKEKIYSNIVYVNTLSNGLAEQSGSGNSFYELINNLSCYPHNTISVYSLTGNKIVDRNYRSDNLLPYLQSNLEQGIYIITINTGEKNSLPVSGKVIIQ